MEENREAKVLLLLKRWREGDRSAFTELAPLVYRELHRLAQFYMRRERAGHTLQATALVNEAFTRLAQSSIPFEDSKHFYALTARLMRHVLTDYAKARGRTKRERPNPNLSQDDSLNPMLEEERFLEVDHALRLLEKQYQDVARIVELHYFGGLTLKQIAAALEVSESTVERSIRFARAWLLAHLQPKSD